MPSTNLSIVIQARDSASSVLRNLEGQTARTGAGFKGLNTSAAGFNITGKGVVGVATAVAAAAAAATAAVVKLTVSFAKNTREASKNAKQARVTYREWGRWEAAAKRTGVEVDNMRDGLFDLSLAQGEAIQEAGAMRNAFAELGFTIEDLQATSTADLMYDFIDALAGVEDQALATAMASQVLGEGTFRDLAPLFEAGSYAARAFGDEAERSGAIASQAMVDMADRFHNAMQQAEQAMVGLNNSIATIMLPGVTLGQEIIAGLAEYVSQSLAQTGIETQNIWTGVWTFIVGVVKNSARVIALIVDGILSSVRLAHNAAVSIGRLVGLQGIDASDYMSHTATLGGLNTAIFAAEDYIKARGDQASLVFEGTRVGRQRQTLYQQARRLNEGNVDIAAEYLERKRYDDLDDHMLDYLGDYFERLGKEHGIELDPLKAMQNRASALTSRFVNAGRNVAGRVGGGGGRRQEAIEPTSAVERARALIGRYDYGDALERTVQRTINAFTGNDFKGAIELSMDSIKAITRARELDGLGGMDIDKLHSAVRDIASAAGTLVKDEPPIVVDGGGRASRRYSAPSYSSVRLAPAIAAAPSPSVQGGPVVNVYVEGYVGSENQLIRVIRGAIDSGELSL